MSGRLPDTSQMWTFQNSFRNEANWSFLYQPDRAKWTSLPQHFKQAGWWAAGAGKVRKTPSWPRSWANFSLLQLYFHRNAWANLHLLGRPDTSHFSLQERQLERWVAAKSGKSKAKVKSRDQGRRAERLDKHRESGL